MGLRDEVFEGLGEGRVYDFIDRVLQRHFAEGPVILGRNVGDAEPKFGPLMYLQCQAEVTDYQVGQRAIQSQGKHLRAVHQIKRSLSLSHGTGLVYEGTLRRAGDWVHRIPRRPAKLYPRPHSCEGCHTGGIQIERHPTVNVLQCLIIKTTPVRYPRRGCRLRPAQIDYTIIGKVGNDRVDDRSVEVHPRQCFQPLGAPHL